MAETYALSAAKRENSKHSARTVRANKRVPAIVYGHGIDPTSISLDASDILRTYRRAGTAGLIDLDIDGQTSKVLIQDLSIHPVKSVIQHVDFYAVNMKEATTVSVPLNYVGESPAIKDRGALLMTDYDHIDIRCLPADIPHDIEVDISSIVEMSDHVTVADLKLDSEKYELMSVTPETILCSVTMPTMASDIASEDAASDEEASADVPVVGEGDEEKTDDE